MPDLLALVAQTNAFSVPLLAAASLLVSKVAQGPSAAAAERIFLATLALVSLVTLRTVIADDAAWLTHTMTLGCMVVGAIVVPAAADTPRNKRKY
jgi:hypothetical protein